jgi:chaperonin cofactor prefoldin
VTLINNDFYRMLEEKSKLQDSLEKRVEKKNLKLKSLYQQIQEAKEKNDEILSQI